MGWDLSLPVMWSEQDEPAQPGRLDLSASSLHLSGGSRDEAYDRKLDVAAIARAYIGRTAGKRIGDRATLVLELHDGRTLRIAGVERPGAVRELAERLQQIVPS
jgi:hypothetical protein